MQSTAVNKKLKAFGIACALVPAALLIGCGAGKNQPQVELIQDMMDQISVKSQDYDGLRQEAGNRVPPAHTVPRGFVPEKYSDPIQAEQNLKSPLDMNDPEVIKQGKYKYDIYCALCHGTNGHAAEDSKLKPYIPLIPPLVSDKVKGFKDGRIYYIITNGQGVMGQYASQIQNAEDRWAIVSYIRTLK
jgi:hypothetical protein